MEELKNKKDIVIRNNGKKTIDVNHKEILEILPRRLRNLFSNMPNSFLKDVEEFRLRANKPLIIYSNGEDYFLTENGWPTKVLHNIFVVNTEDIKTSFRLITDYSIYALEEEIKNGFITIKGGHRIGICGKAIIENNRVKTIKNISGLNIRISKEKIGCGKKVINYIIKDTNSIFNTLIVSPPGCGKTTILRDIIRLISSGISKSDFKGIKVSVVDERSEIAGCYNGIPQKDVGIRTDVLDGCPKAEGMIMLIRAMSPMVIATDEIGKDEDIYALKEAMNAGVKFITTVHGDSIEEISRRSNIFNLVENKVFERMIILTNQPRVGTVKEVIDLNTNEVLNNNILMDRRDSYIT
ncbi:stage III sporulation protein AA [Maledivibacter halophilus]|uniref:Stage III sporulation protein AA n=1 Tax=Maledivibacter halophilus TaxID=36842 RepID=A0A1T5L812_9FIRM|nr:stage III sporulation protein AA [Maledivibacter halophilus]SKC72196.1 stage III sporulation protein AA [Maledivibacter halophilus]